MKKESYIWIIAVVIILGMSLTNSDLMSVRVLQQLSGHEDSLVFELDPNIPDHPYPTDKITIYVDRSTGSNYDFYVYDIQTDTDWWGQPITHLEPSGDMTDGDCTTPVSYCQGGPYSEVRFEVNLPPDGDYRAWYKITDTQGGIVYKSGTTSFTVGVVECQLTPICGSWITVNTLSHGKHERAECRWEEERFRDDGSKLCFEYEGSKYRVRCDSGYVVEGTNLQVSDEYDDYSTIYSLDCIDISESEEIEDETPTAPEETGASCTDSDGGIDFFEKGTAYSYYDATLMNAETDYCIDSGEIVEKSCKSDGTIKTERKLCIWFGDYECVNGECVEKSLENIPEYGEDEPEPTSPENGDTSCSPICNPNAGDQSKIDDQLFRRGEVVIFQYYPDLNECHPISQKKCGYEYVGCYNFSDGAKCVNCRPGRIRCTSDNQGIEKCKSDGTGWTVTKSCSEDQVCSHEECVEYETPSDEIKRDTDNPNYDPDNPNSSCIWIMEHYNEKMYHCDTEEDCNDACTDIEKCNVKWYPEFKDVDDERWIRKNTEAYERFDLPLMSLISDVCNCEVRIGEDLDLDDGGGEEGTTDYNGGTRTPDKPWYDLSGLQDKVGDIDSKYLILIAAAIIFILYTMKKKKPKSRRRR